MSRTMTPEERRERAQVLETEVAQLERQVNRMRRQARKLADICPPDCGSRSRPPRWRGDPGGCDIPFPHWPGDSWRRKGLTPPETDDEHRIYAEWVEAHDPEILNYWVRIFDDFSDRAIHRLDGAVLLNACGDVVKRWDCDFPCEHYGGES